MSKSYDVCLQLLEQRGYTCITPTEDEGEKKITAKKEDNSVICVYFCKDAKLNKSVLNKYLVDTDEQNSRHLIIVHTGLVTSITNKSIEQTIDMEIELFADFELQFNITMHRLQPKSFEKIDKSTCIKYKKLYGNNFPHMLTKDPIARFYNYKKGDMIKITSRKGVVNFRVVK